MILFNPSIQKYNSAAISFGNKQEKKQETAKQTSQNSEYTEMMYNNILGQNMRFKTKGLVMDYKAIMKKEQDKENIVRELLPYDYMTIISDIFEKGEFLTTNTSIVVKRPKDKRPYITIAVVKPSEESDEPTLQYEDYSIRDFVDILERLKSKKIKQHPKSSKKFETASYELSDKLLNL